jgi:hypothetical protein
LGFGVGFAVAIILTWGISRSSSLPSQSTHVEDNVPSPMICPTTSPNQPCHLKEDEGHLPIVQELKSNRLHCTSSSSEHIFSN